MDLSDVRKIKVHRSKKHRVGRGPGSGWGTTAGRGNKGAGQRSGTRYRLRFEGGQMPLFRRLPKKGFSNARFKVSYYAVNVGALEKTFGGKRTIDMDLVKSYGLAPKKAKFLKILGFGDVTKPLNLSVHAISAGAREKIEKAGGVIQLLPTATEHRAKGVTKRGAGPVAVPTPPPVIENDAPGNDASDSESE